MLNQVFGDGYSTGSESLVSLVNILPAFLLRLTFFEARILGRGCVYALPLYALVAFFFGSKWCRSNGILWRFQEERSLRSMNGKVGFLIDTTENSINRMRYL